MVNGAEKELKIGRQNGEKSSIQGSSGRLGIQGSKGGQPREGGAGLQTARIVPGGAIRERNSCIFGFLKKSPMAPFADNRGIKVKVEK